MLKEKNKKTIILLGYDYIQVILEIVKDENVFCLILAKDKHYFSKKNLSVLKELMGNRLYEENILSKDILEIISKNKINRLLTFGWRRLIDVDDFNDLQYLINIHPAILPQYKGYHPVPYVILNEEKRHGITAHLISSEMDAGDIVLQELFEINPFSTLKSLQDEVMKLMPNFLKKLFELINTDHLNLSYNDDSKTIVKAPRRSPADSRVALSDSLGKVFKQVKASDNERFPVYFEYLGEKVYISMWRDEATKKHNRFDI